MRSYNLRGTNGSGKTFVARNLLKKFWGCPIRRTERGKVEVYEGNMNGIPLFFLGSYETQCGGCDTIPSVGRVAELLKDLMSRPEHGIVFFEGLMISHMLGTVGAMQAQLGKQNNVLAFLDTPLEVCIERVKLRRLERGNEKPFDPRNIVADHPRVRSCMAKAIQQGYKVIVINHDNALEQVETDLMTLAGGGDI